jgi:diguanylate cyclase (GGDEF)-like protein
VTILTAFLLLGIIPVHLASSRGGRRPGVITAAIIAAAYTLLVAAGVTPLSAGQWIDPLIALGAFAIVAWVVTAGHDAARARLDRMSGMVMTDALTGCLNRRGFDHALSREVARATRSGADLSLLALDIDHFKIVNDSRGHPAGDVVLCQLGELLRMVAREGDLVARTGGEEFSIILPDTTVDGALTFANRLCEEVRAHAFGHPGVTVAITASIGVASARESTPDPAGRLRDVLQHRADEALYAAKRSGRDRAQAWLRRHAAQRDRGVLS